MISIPAVLVLILMGISTYIGFYFLWLFFKQFSEKYLLVFTLLCFSIALYDLFGAALYNSSSAQESIPYAKGVFTAAGLIAPLLVIFINLFLKGHIKRNSWVFVFIGFLYIILLHLTEYGVDSNNPHLQYIPILGSTHYTASPGIFSHIYFFLVICWVGYNSISVFQHYRQQKKYVLPILIGILFFFGAIVNDILTVSEVISSIYLLEYGFFCIVIGVSSGIIAKYSSLQAKIQSLNSSLEQKVKERTNQLENAMKEIQRSNTDLEQFAYVASHDLQEPLRMVASYIKLIEKRNKDKLDTDSKEFVEFAVDGAVRMQQLINDLLTYSRVSTKAKPFEVTQCATAYEKAIKNLEISIREHEAKITQNDLPEIMADEVQLIQLFQNLIGNAIKFCRNRIPEVHVSASEDKGEWIFGVRDNGIGIASDHRERIFQIFQRLHNREEYKGTGIGLAVCKKIVERHGGKIWLDSREGQGTTFWFSIPIRTENEEQVIAKETNLL